MRISVKKTHIDEQTIEAFDEEITIYHCDECNFESENEEEVIKHYGFFHAPKEEKGFSGLEFIRFETETDMDAWSEAANLDESFYNNYDEITVAWKGPGWYKISGKSQPCGRGCCSKYVMFLEPINITVSNLENEINEKQAQLKSIREKLNL